MMRVNFRFSAPINLAVLWPNEMTFFQMVSDIRPGIMLVTVPCNISVD